VIATNGRENSVLSFAVRSSSPTPNSQQISLLPRFNRHKDIILTQKRRKNKNSPYLTHKTRAEGDVIQEEQNRPVTSREYPIIHEDLG
jgi:hypothetical protein